VSDARSNKPASRRAVFAALVGLTAPAAAPIQPRLRKAYFTAADHHSVLAEPASIAAIYAANRARFLADLGPHFAAESEEQIKFGFCGVLAYDLKPYGDSGHGITLNRLLAQPTMVCDHYAALAWKLFLLMVRKPTLKIAAVGWNGGAVGNHCQLISSTTLSPGDGTGHWLVDPTVGIIQAGYDYNWIASGRSCSADLRRDFYWRSGPTDRLHGLVLAALAHGKYKPSDILYYCSSVARFCHPPDEADWMTPQADTLIGRDHPERG
jgi:hypothetical protein